jgi:hypothetical protein
LTTRCGLVRFPGWATAVPRLQAVCGQSLAFGAGLIADAQADGALRPGVRADDLARIFAVNTYLVRATAKFRSDTPRGPNVRRCSQCAARLPEGSRRSRRYCSAACRVGDVAKAAVARVLADPSYSAQYGRQQVGAQRRQIGQIEGVSDVTTVPPGREQARAAQDGEVAGNLRG